MSPKNLILLLVLLVGVNSQGGGVGTGPTEVVENQVFDLNLTPGQVLRYKYTLSSITTQTGDFTVYAEGSDYRSDIDVYISKKPDTDPSLTSWITDKSTVVCDGWGNELCVLQKSDILNNFQPTKAIFFDITCIEKCSGNFRVQFAKNLNLTLGQKLTYYTTKTNKVATFDFYVPKLEAEFKKIIISFDLRNYNDMTSDYYITLIDSGGDPISGESNWDLGKSFVIEKSDSSWCT